MARHEVRWERMLPHELEAAFATFFMQTPSFLFQQTALARGHGTSNCQSLFAVCKIPSDNHIRPMLDPVPPEHLLPMFDAPLARDG